MYYDLICKHAFQGVLTKQLYVCLCVHYVASVL